MSKFSKPRILAGDINGLPDNPGLLDLAADYYDSWEVARLAGKASAYPDNPVDRNTRTHRNRINYIFYSKQASVKTSGSKVPDQRDQLPQTENRWNLLDYI